MILFNSVINPFVNAYGSKNSCVMLSVFALLFFTWSQKEKRQWYPVEKHRMYRAVWMFLKGRQRANQFFICIKEANITEVTHCILITCLHSRIQRKKITKFILWRNTSFISYMKCSYTDSGTTIYKKRIFTMQKREKHAFYICGTVSHCT